VNTRLSQTQTLRNSQEQQLNPMIIQSLKVLTLPIMELSTLLSAEILENPLLELGDGIEEDDRTPAEKEAENTQEKTDDVDDDLAETLEESKELSEILDQWNEYHSEMSAPADSSSSDDEINYENFLQADDSPKLDFLSRFDEMALTESEYSFIYELFDNADNYGFLPKDYDIYALAKEYGLTKPRAYDLHVLILRTYPRGITARNISECLFHQLEENEQNSLVARIIMHNFDDLLHKRYDVIAEKHGVTIEDVLMSRDRISRLDPKPGLRIHTGKAQYIVPDLFLVKMDDDFEIIVNDFHIPKVTFSRRYQNILTEMAKDKNAINYVRGKINRANFLIKTIFMRHKTLKTVMRSILDHQHAYFYENSGILEPLTYAMIAGEMGVNESTISRVVKTKYADTHLGVFCLKEFFATTAAKDKTSEIVSRQSVQQQIKIMITNEDKSAPISDQDIVDVLNERGINVSRRVITKYREAMGIGNSRQRRVVSG